jgi:hypothetical protein
VLVLSTQDLADGLAREAQAAHASEEIAQLAGADVGMLDVKAHDARLDVRRCLVPWRPPTRAEARRLRAAAEPTPEKATKRADQAMTSLVDPTTRVVDRDRQRSRAPMSAIQMEAWSAMHRFMR